MRGPFRGLPAGTARNFQPSNGIYCQLENGLQVKVWNGADVPPCWVCSRPENRDAGRVRVMGGEPANGSKNSSTPHSSTVGHTLRPTGGALADLRGARPQRAAKTCAVLRHRDVASRIRMFSQLEKWLFIGVLVSVEIPVVARRSRRAAWFRVGGFQRGVVPLMGQETC